MTKKDPDCERCNDSGLVAKRNKYPCAYVCPGPVPDDARNVYEAFCDCETGSAMRRKDRARVAADELASLGLSIPKRATEYMKRATTELAKACPDCRGAGAVDREVTKRDLLVALLRDAGARTNIEVPGDTCSRCGGAGKICDERATIRRAAELAAKDYADIFEVKETPISRPYADVFDALGLVCAKDA